MSIKYRVPESHWPLITHPSPVSILFFKWTLMKEIILEKKWKKVYNKICLKKIFIKKQKKS